MPSQHNPQSSVDPQLVRRLCLVVLVCFVALVIAQAIVLPISGRYLLPWYMWTVTVAFAAAAFAELTGRYPLGVPVGARKRPPPDA